MKIKFLKDHDFYLAGDTRTMYRKKAGDEFDYDNEAVIQKWSDRGIIEKIEDKKPVKKVEKVVETAEDKQEEKETKPVTTKKTTHKRRKK